MFHKRGLVLAIGALSAAGLAQAQEGREVESLRGENFQLEEVLVTARKRIRLLH